MELIPTETSLVVAGSWNAAILTPAWFSQHALGRPAGEQARVQVFFPVVPGALLEFPRYSIEALSYIVRPDAFIVAPSNITPEALHISEAAVARVLQVLSHTPITGVGHNFEFRDQAPSPEEAVIFTTSRQDVADRMPAGWTPTSALITSSFKNETETVQINVQRYWDSGTISVKFNFHHAVSNAEQAIAVLEGAGHYQRITQNLDLAKRLIKSLYGKDQRD